MDETMSEDTPQPPTKPIVPEPFDQHGRVLRAASIFVGVFSIALLLILGRVVQLQVAPDPQIAEALEGRTSAAPLMARRGAILDARGRIIAASHRGYRLFADPSLIEDPAEFALHLAHAIGEDPARIDRLINERFDKRYVKLVDLLTDEQLAVVRQLDLRAIGLEPRPVRDYPQGPLAGQVVGFVGHEHKGLNGLEYALDPVLTGTGGRVEMLRDVRRRALWIERAGYTPAQDGYGVRLSLDMVIQGYADLALAETCEQYEAKSGNVVVMDSRNGQLLAMSNWPPFDPTAPSADQDLWRNRCVTDPYEPGSIFKPFIWAAALSMNQARPGEMFDCTTSGVWRSTRGRRLRDAHPIGRVDFNHVLINSSNIGMAIVGERMGKKKLYESVRAFGFGTDTGSGLPGESPGIVNPLRRWNHYSVTSIPMGQEVSTTALQMARAFTAFANEGVMVAPSILAGEDADPVLTRVITGDAAELTKQALRKTVVEGTGRRANSKLYQLWGKTGTAQVAAPDRRGYLDGAYTGSFICGAPLDNPRLVVIVTVHQPNAAKGYYGGVVAAPVAKKIVEQSLQYLRVPPDTDEAVRNAPVAIR